MSRTLWGAAIFFCATLVFYAAPVGLVLLFVICINHLIEKLVTENEEELSE
jgi:hypothetical protein